MKNTLILTFILLTNNLVFAKEINFYKGTWDEALAQSKKENKIIFVDFYTTWCSPCKFMTANVFTNDEVADFFNQNFINVKIDAEKQELQLVKNSAITGYPTLAFFNSSGELFFRKMGGIDAQAFLLLGLQISSFERNKKAIEKDPLNINALGPYLHVLSQIDQEKAKKMATAYLEKIKIEDSKIAGNWDLITVFELSASSRFFDYTIENFKFFLDSMPGYQDYFAQVSGNLLQDAVAEKDLKKLTRYKDIAKQAMNQMGTGNPESFMLEVDIYYYAQTGQLDLQLKAMDEWIMNYVTDVEVISNNATQMMDKHGKVAFEYALRWANKTISLQTSSYTFLTVSFVYRENGMKTEALKYAEKSLELAGPDDDTEYIKQFIEEIRKME